MSFQLPPEIDQRIQAHLALGMYPTAEAVINEALDALEQRNSDLAAILAGIEDEKAGRVRPLVEVDRDLRQRFDIPSPG